VIMHDEPNSCNVKTESSSKSENDSEESENEMVIEEFHGTGAPKLPTLAKRRTLRGKSWNKRRYLRTKLLERVSCLNILCCNGRLQSGN